MKFNEYHFSKLRKRLYSDTNSATSQADFTKAMSYLKFLRICLDEHLPQDRIYLKKLKNTQIELKELFAKRKIEYRYLFTDQINPAIKIYKPHHHSN